MGKRVARRVALQVSGGVRWTWASAPRQLAAALSVVVVGTAAMMAGAAVVYMLCRLFYAVVFG